jgi:transposase-like protein
MHRANFHIPKPKLRVARNVRGYLRTDQGPLEIKVPRDRDGTFEPAIVPKHQRKFKGFED